MSFEFSAKAGELAEVLRGVAARVDALQTDDDLCSINVEQTTQALKTAANALAYASRRAFIAAEDDARQQTNLISQLKASLEQQRKEVTNGLG